MKCLMFTVVFITLLYPLTMVESAMVDDNFGDGDIATNITGAGTGFNIVELMGGSVTESGSSVNIINTMNGAARAGIVSKDGAMVGAGITRFVFRGIRFSLSEENPGSLSRQALGVRGDSTAEDVDNGIATGFWIQIENNSLLSANPAGGANGTSILFYESKDDVKTKLAEWTFNTLDWHSEARNFTPVLDITLELDSKGYSLNIEGDTVTLVSGSLSNTFAAAGIANELTTGHAFVFSQTEGPSVNISIDQITINGSGAARNPGPSIGEVCELETIKQLTWTSADGPIVDSVSGYDLILGTEPNILLNTKYTNVTSPFVLADHGITLDYETVYYWSVNSHIVWNSQKSAGSSLKEIVTGGVWDFRTLCKDRIPDVVADTDDLDLLTSMEFLPAHLTGAVKDYGEKDITSIKWEVIGTEVLSTAMQMIARGGDAIVQNLEKITDDPGLFTDWIGTDARQLDNSLELIIEGLPTGTYSWKSYHHDPQDQHGELSVTVFDADYDKNNASEAKTVVISNADNLPIATYITKIRSDGTNSISILYKLKPFDNVAERSTIVINGFELNKGEDSLKIDFGQVNGARAKTEDYHFYEAEHENASTFTKRNYKAFDTTVSILPKWGSVLGRKVEVADSTNSVSSALQSAILNVDKPGVYYVRMTATDKGKQSSSDIIAVQVEENSCIAAQNASSWTGFDAFDLDKDCKVTLEEYAIFANQWFNDLSLTEQVREDLEKYPSLGNIQREVWTGLLSTNKLTDLTNIPEYPDNPSLVTYLNTFEIPADWGDSYGSRVRGLLVPQSTGYFRFWISGDDDVELWLSSDDDPENITRIAYIQNGFSDRLNFDQFPSQKSGLFYLQAAKKYYIMALHKEWNGGDHMAVAWQGPDSPTRAVIDGIWIQPFIEK